MTTKNEQELFEEIMLKRTPAEVLETEAELEGLQDQNTELERLVEQHKARYAGLLRVTESKIQMISELQNTLKALVADHIRFGRAVNEATNSVRALRDVPVSDLDDAVARVANALDAAGA